MWERELGRGMKVDMPQMVKSAKHRQRWELASDVQNQEQQGWNARLRKTVLLRWCQKFLLWNYCVSLLSETDALENFQAKMQETNGCIDSLGVEVKATNTKLDELRELIIATRRDWLTGFLEMEIRSPYLGASVEAMAEHLFPHMSRHFEYVNKLAKPVRRFSVCSQTIIKVEIVAQNQDRE